MPYLSSQKSRVIYWALALFVFACLPRIAAYGYNILPHGDIHLDYAAAWGLRTQGKLILPIITHHSYLESQQDTGYPLDQHAPLWPVIGGLAAEMNGDIFHAFKILSLISGCLLVPLSFFAVQKVFNEISAWLTAICIGVAYILIDYSGNGSLYSLHALLLIIIILIFRGDRAWNCLFSGLFSGLAYLLNYQAVTILPAACLLFLVNTRSGENRENNFKNLGIYLGGAFIVALPWFVRNQLVFGSPFFTANTDYILGNLGLSSSISLVEGHLLRRWNWQSFSAAAGLVKIGAWLVRNLGYFCLRIVVLAPVISFFIPAGFNACRKDQRKENNEKRLIWILLLVFHLALAIAWPVFKFRYFVPLLPLWFGLGAYGMSHILTGKRRKILAGAMTIFGILLVSIVTFLRVPSHTNYYDSNEFFHYRTGESEWWADENSLVQALGCVEVKPGDVIIAPLEAFYYTRHTILTPESLNDTTTASQLIDQHTILWIVDRRDRHTFYTSFLNTRLVFQNEAFIVLQIQ